MSNQETEHVLEQVDTTDAELVDWSTQNSVSHEYPTGTEILNSIRGGD